MPFLPWGVLPPSGGNVTMPPHNMLEHAIKIKWDADLPDYPDREAVARRHQEDHGNQRPITFAFF
jgi:hypothetical protein